MTKTQGFHVKNIAEAGHLVYRFECIRAHKNAGKAMIKPIANVKAHGTTGMREAPPSCAH